MELYKNCTNGNVAAFANLVEKEDTGFDETTIEEMDEAKVEEVDTITQSKAMRMAVYPELCDSAMDLLNKVIAKEKNPSEKLFEVIIANFISRQWPRPYSTEEFWKYGIDGQGDLLNSMMSSLRGKEEKPKRRNWIGSTHHFGDTNEDF